MYNTRMNTQNPINNLKISKFLKQEIINKE